MPLSDSIDDDSFESAHRLTLEGTPKLLLATEFSATFTRHLINELSRAGVEEVKFDRERSTVKIQTALEAIQRQKDEKWPIFVQNRTALRMALEHELAARTTFSEMPSSIRRITETISVPPPARTPSTIPPSAPSNATPFHRPTQRLDTVIPPANDPLELNRKG